MAQRMEAIIAGIDVQSKSRIQIQKELDSNDSVSIPYEVVKSILSNFHKLLEITTPEDKRTLLQLIIKKENLQIMGALLLFLFLL